jgi:hypothetical protein
MQQLYIVANVKFSQLQNLYDIQLGDISEMTINILSALKTGFSKLLNCNT